MQRKRDHQQGDQGGLPGKGVGVMGSEGQVEGRLENWEQSKRTCAPDSTLMCAGPAKRWLMSPLPLLLESSVEVLSRDPGQTNLGFSLGILTSCSVTLGSHFTELWFIYL